MPSGPPIPDAEGVVARRHYMLPYMPAAAISRAKCREFLSQRVCDVEEGGCLSDWLCLK